MVGTDTRSIREALKYTWLNMGGGGLDSSKLFCFPQAFSVCFTIMEFWKINNNCQAQLQLQPQLQLSLKLTGLYSLFFHTTQPTTHPWKCSEPAYLTDLTPTLTTFRPKPQPNLNLNSNLNLNLKLNPNQPQPQPQPQP